MLLNRYRNTLRISTWCLAAAVCSSLQFPWQTARAEAEHERGDLLFICAGDQARTAPDFLAVINFEEESEDYGKVIATVPFPAPDATGNEPHHIGISPDGKVVACGGLL